MTIKITYKSLIVMANSLLAGGLKVLVKDNLSYQKVLLLILWVMSLWQIMEIAIFKSLIVMANSLLAGGLKVLVKDNLSISMISLSILMIMCMSTMEEKIRESQSLIAMANSLLAGGLKAQEMVNLMKIMVLT